MNLIKDFMLINQQVLKKSFTSLKKNVIIILTGIAYILISTVTIGLVLTIFQGVLSIFAGIALVIINASLISNYLYLLYNVVNYDKITFQDFKDGFTHFLRKIYTVLFFAWIGSFLLGIVQGALGIDQNVVNLIVTISIFILLNPLPETLYLKVHDPMDSIMYSVDFMKENWINWLIPNLLLYGALYYLTGRVITGIFTTHISLGFGLDLPSIAKYLVGQVLFSFTMIYRGHLFKLLSTSTRRKRMYMNKYLD